MTDRDAIFLIALAVSAGAAYYLYRQSGADESASTDYSALLGAGGAAVPTDNAPAFGIDFLGDVQSVFGMSQPIGLRLHNPGNLRYLTHDAWDGQIGNEQGFGVYVSDEAGCRAMGHQLMKYYRSGLLTVSDIVSTWAPRSENDTASYINAVCRRMGVLSNQPLALPGVLGSLMAAMIVQEQGVNPFRLADLQYWGTEL